MASRAWSVISWSRLVSEAQAALMTRSPRTARTCPMPSAREKDPGAARAATCPRLPSDRTPATGGRALPTGRGSCRFRWRPSSGSSAGPGGWHARRSSRAMRREWSRLACAGGAAPHNPGSARQSARPDPGRASGPPATPGLRARTTSAVHQWRPGTGWEGSRRVTWHQMVGVRVSPDRKPGGRQVTLDLEGLGRRHAEHHRQLGVMGGRVHRARSRPGWCGRHARALADRPRPVSFPPAEAPFS